MSSRDKRRCAARRSVDTLAGGRENDDASDRLREAVQRTYAVHEQTRKRSVTISHWLIIRWVDENKGGNL